MNRHLIVAALFVAAAAAPAFGDTATTATAPAAAEPAKALTPQQQKMKDCNAEAKTKALKGNDRKAFMKTCLSADAAPAEAATAAAATTETKPAGGREAQQQKMKDCNKQASEKALKGKDRKSFMSTCLKTD